jgi:hypothetical protein
MACAPAQGADARGCHFSELFVSGRLERTLGGTALAVEATSDRKEAIVIRSFITGAIAGGAAMWIWGPDIKRRIDDRTRRFREGAAGRLHGAAQSLDAAARTVEQGLGEPTPRRFEQLDSSVN